jgi:hypothetical protein
MGRSALIVIIAYRLTLRTDIRLGQVAPRMETVLPKCVFYTSIDDMQIITDTVSPVLRPNNILRVTTSNGLLRCPRKSRGRRTWTIKVVSVESARTHNTHIAYMRSRYHAFRSCRQNRSILP